MATVVTLAFTGPSGCLPPSTQHLSHDSHNVSGASDTGCGHEPGFDDKGTWSRRPRTTARIRGTCELCLLKLTVLRETLEGWRPKSLCGLYQSLMPMFLKLGEAVEQALKEISGAQGGSNHLHRLLRRSRAAEGKGQERWQRQGYLNTLASYSGAGWCQRRSQDQGRWKAMPASSTGKGKGHETSPKPSGGKPAESTSEGWTTVARRQPATDETKFELTNGNWEHPVVLYQDLATEFDKLPGGPGPARVL